MTFEAVAVFSPVSARPDVVLDMMFPSLSADDALYTSKSGFRYCQKHRRCQDIAPGPKCFGGHENASRGYPAREDATLRRRHQHGVDHMDDAVRLVDVADGDRCLVALGIDDPGL